MHMKQPWFGKRRYGYGWGMPQTWQGWLTLIIWFILVLASTKMLPKDRDTHINKALPWFGVMFVLVTILGLICYKTSGKPEWHWGDVNDQNEK